MLRYYDLASRILILYFWISEGQREMLLSRFETFYMKVSRVVSLKREGNMDSMDADMMSILCLR